MYCKRLDERNAMMKRNVVMFAVAAGSLMNAAVSLGTEGKEILNTDSPLRVFTGYSTPVQLSSEGGIKPLDKKDGPMRLFRFPAPPASEWTKPDYDDLGWAREHAPVRGVAGGSSSWAIWSEASPICIRVKFQTPDPVKADGLRLKVRYNGGIVVYINGVEIRRGHLPGGQLSPDALAEKYADEAYVDAEGAILWRADSHADRVATRVREIELQVPRNLLRKGVNVIGLDLRRAPVNQVIFKAKRAPQGVRGEIAWPHAALMDLSMIGPHDCGVVANTEMPKGVRVWPVQPLETLTTWCWGDPCETAQVVVDAARNGAFSGRFVISSDGPLRCETVSVADLRKDDGTLLPATAVVIRYALRADPKGSWMDTYTRTGLHRFDVLSGEAPQEVPVVSEKIPIGLLSNSPWSHPLRTCASGAMLPVWVTVNVPSGTKPGTYKTDIMVKAAGMEATRVPLTVRVHGWRIPDAENYITSNLFYESPDSIALAYGVPLWSERHFEMIGKAMALSKSIANKLCQVPLIVEAADLGNSQSMVRWIDKGNGKYDYDFIILDRYLDLYAKNVGKPRALAITVWGDLHRVKKYSVTRLNQAEGKTELMDQPPYGTPASLDFWKPVMDELRKRLEKRGWWDVAMLADTGDRQPTPETVGVFRQIWPDGRWIAATHTSYTTMSTEDKKTVSVIVGQRVWGVGRLFEPDNTGYGSAWQLSPDIVDLYRLKEAPRDCGRVETAFPRSGIACVGALFDGSRLALWYVAPEAAFLGGVHGYGRVGLDFWPIPNRSRGKFDSLAGSSNLGLGHSTKAILGVGKNGPEATERSQMFVEGTQVCEGLRMLRSALVKKKIPPDLQKRACDLIDERARHYFRTTFVQGSHEGWIPFEGSGWQERDGKLFALCAEIEAAVSK